MRRGALLLVWFVAACDPKPGARITVNGTVTDITDDPGLPTPVATKHVVADGKFYWNTGGWLVSRPIGGGDQKQLAYAGNGNDIVVTRDHVVLRYGRMNHDDEWKLVAVPRAGGEPRTISLPLLVGGYYGELRALSDAVLWLEPSYLHDNIAAPGHEVVTTRIMMLSLKDERPVPRIVVDSPKQIARLETDGRGGFVTANAIVDKGYSIDVYDSVSAGPREVQTLPFAQYDSAEDRAPMGLALGTEHVFMTKPQHALMSMTIPLVAVPRQGGRSVTVSDAVCSGHLSVSGDVPFFVTPSSGTRCPGEFPAPQKLELRRGSLTAKPTLLYQAFDTYLWLEQVAANQIILREGVPVPRSVPPVESRYRSALFTFQP